MRLRDQLLKQRQRSQAPDLEQQEEKAVDSGEREGQTNAQVPEADEIARVVQSAEWAPLDAHLAVNACGSFIRRRRQFPLAHRHGYAKLGDLLSCADVLEQVAVKPGDKSKSRLRKGAPLLPASADEELAELAHSSSAPPLCERMLFLDTETTGLGVGTGNVPFMIGIGYFREQVFVVDQMLIRNPAEERAMLHELKRLLATYTHLVTYNGRTFDWPVVRNRFVMHRMEVGELDRFAHLDFLYPSRSLYRKTLPSCRLSMVEERRLGVYRHDDVPGSLAPELYVKYLAEQKPSILEGVFHHNEWDILTLNLLAAHFAALADGSASFDSLEASEVFRAGVWFDNQGMHDRAEAAYRYLMELQPEARQGIQYELAIVLKKKGELHTAVQLWKESLQDSDASPAAAIEARVQLAMTYEHRLKDIPLALHYAEQAKELALRRLSLARGRDSGKQRAQLNEITKRIDRLRRKAASQDRTG